MDQELQRKIDSLTQGRWEKVKGGKRGEEAVEFSLWFGEQEGETVVKMETTDGEGFQHQLEALEDLWSKLEKGSKVKLGGKEEEYYPLLMGIESAISGYYKEHPNLKDRGVIRALQAFIRNPGLSYQGGLRKRIQQHLQFTLSTHKYTRREVKACLKYVLRSAKRHHAREGPKGYLEFIVNYI